MTRTAITGGLVVNASDSLRAAVLIDGETIVAVAHEDSDLVRRFCEDAEVVDATGKYVIPGGIDAHTHMEAGQDPTTSSDTFETGTIAAAHGGTTTILDFAAPLVGGSVLGAVERYHDKANGSCAVDYGFHVMTRDVDATTFAEMSMLVDQGVTSFKMFTAYPGQWYSTDDTIFRVMRHAGEIGALVMMHAENGLVIDVLRDEAALRGDTAPVWHSLTRPEALEAEAVHRVARLAEVAGAPVYIVHLSSAPALEEVERARRRGVRISAETCPQYLFLGLEDLRKPDFVGSQFVCSPPVRHEAHNHHALWRGLATGGLATVATDHCPFCMHQKELGLADFRAIPNGVPGVEHRVEQIYEGVVQGHLTLNRWVEVCSTQVAKTFGLHPRKGLLAAGADADVVVFDPNRPRTISAQTHHMNVDYSAYEGQTLPGSVVTTFLRGKKIVDDGQFCGTRSGGAFLKRSVGS
ncbi:dihydropyrimidinase [Actinotalea fermentans]|uniref:Dihydropyrimidinase n=1 Tax=Actinotalea fermentans TaxID=43671 RepID=A0A511YXD7_9CELL|nr:dihydropyrimidinase [Actinotalea fermentans]KGM17647.1 phenylhydantoinase [Actinotalea fermentans ATCC 43279 = JCM 9966 = DSM 3133]GEN79864.1 dihydropyrimidinase [Actinotalea fermentans]